MNLIIFDIDETLTQSDTQHKTAFINSMKEIGITKIDENWSAYNHHTDSFILKENYEYNLNTSFKLSTLDDFENRMISTMQSLKKIEEVKGAQNFVNYLRNEKKYAIAFATGSLLKPAILKLEQSSIWFDKQLIASSNSFYEREEIVKDAIEKAKQFYSQKNFENIISIGDGIWDLKTAKNLNLKFIGVGGKNHKEFQKENTTVVTDNWINFDFENAEMKLGIN